MKVLVLLLLSMALACRAQTAPTIKGHALGESLQEFVDSSNATTKHVVQWCGTDKTEFSPIICENITNILAKPAAAPPNLDVHCDTVIVGMLAAFPQSSSPVPTESYAKSWCADFTGDITFENGKLVRIKTDIGNSWGEAYGALVKKFGKPTTIQSRVLQNGFGAKFRTTNGFWVKKGYRVCAWELFSEDGDRYVLLEMTTPAYTLEQAQELKKSQASTLD